MNFKKVKEYDSTNGYLEFVQQRKLETNFYLGKD